MSITVTEARQISKRTGKSFEQIFLERTGREARTVAPVRPAINRTAWLAAAQQATRNLFAAAERAAAAERSAAAEAARNADEVKGLLFPWEN